MLDKKFIVGGVVMTSPLIVGAGVCKHPEAMGPYMRTDLPIGAVVTGSYTPFAREGNQGTIVWPATFNEVLEYGAGLNSMGMPNMGNEKAVLELRRLQPRLALPYIASIAGFTVEDYMHGVVNFDLDNNSGASAIEINLGCPNVQDKHPLPIACSIDRTREVLLAVAEAGPKVPVWVKLSPCLTKEEVAELKGKFPWFNFDLVPTFDYGQYKEILELLAKYTFVRAVVLNNTLPNARAFDSAGTSVTTPNDGKAGMSGPAMFEITRNSVVRARNILLSSETGIDIIASGGIVDGDGAAEMLELGAAAVACTSGPYWTGGPRFFADMLQSERLQNFLTRN